jgi:hypothetical protein
VCLFFACLLLSMSVPNVGVARIVYCCYMILCVHFVTVQGLCFVAVILIVPFVAVHGLCFVVMTFWCVCLINFILPHVT